MTGGLPRGFVKINADLGSDLLQLDQPRDNELYKLWKVYTLNKAILNPDEGARLENLFWRIWSNPAVKTNMSGQLLAKLFQPVADGESLLPERPARFDITPTPGSPSSKPAPLDPEQDNFSAEASSSLQTVRPSSPPQQPADPIRPQQVDTQRLKFTKSGPSPILKKPKNASGEVPTFQQQPALLRDCNEPVSSHPLSFDGAPRYGSPTIASSDSSEATRRKRAFFLSTSSETTVLRSATRRQRGSQGSDRFELSPRNTRGKAIGPNSTSYRQQEAGKQTHPTPDEPGDFWQDVESDSESAESSSAQSPKAGEWLVAKDFRGRFKDSQKQTASQTNVPSLGKTLSVRFLDELPNESQSKIKIKPQVLEGRNRPFSSERMSQDSSEAPSHLEQDAETGSAAALPRTKSQLSMIIETNRRAGSADRNPPTHLGSLPAQRTRNKESLTADDDEEEGIVMGIGVGKTKVTKKGKKSDKRREQEAPNYHSPPSGPVW